MIFPLPFNVSTSTATKQAGLNAAVFMPHMKWVWVGSGYTRMWKHPYLQDDRKKIQEKMLFS